MTEHQEEIAQRVFDSFPDKEPLKDFDDFFVGGGYRPGMESPDAHSIGWQLSHIHTVADLKRGAPPEGLVEAEDDLDLFIAEKVDLVDPEQYEKIFLTMKSKAFSLFGFIDILSSAMGDVPVREKDLLLDENDYYIIEYLKEKVTDYFAVSSIATLVAYENMGIELVKFRQIDGCPVCSALDGGIFTTGWLINMLGSNNHISHNYCPCKLVPIIRREMYEGPLQGRLDTEPISAHPGLYLNFVPVELKEEILSFVKTNIPAFEGIEYIEFVDMKRDLASVSIDRDGVVAFRKDNYLHVHNSYVDASGPLEFLKAYLEEKKTPDAVEVEPQEEDEVFYLGGKKAIFRGGRYWDAATGERLK